MELQPIDFDEAREFIRRFHRHHLPPQGWKFGLAATKEEQIIGVATVGLPVSRMLNDGWTLEVTRNCTDGTKNACSFLYGAARRAAFALGWRRIITYIGKDEPGISLVAAGWRCLGLRGGGNWNRKSRVRIAKHPIGQKLLWESIA